MNFQDMQWSCHICNRVRNDADISVHTFTLKDMTGATANIRYCNDSAACYNEAIKRGLEGKWV